MARKGKRYFSPFHHALALLTHYQFPLALGCSLPVSQFALQCVCEETKSLWRRQSPCIIVPEKRCDIYVTHKNLLGRSLSWGEIFFNWATSKFAQETCFVIVGLLQPRPPDKIFYKFNEKNCECLQ